MAAVGIIAEYNPYHRGHQYHLEQAKARSGCKHAVCVMSGNFVQRGEPAAFDKRLRTRAALTCGVDMVLELPTVFALSSAEGFARGGIRILAGTGIVSHLAFGAENDDLSTLARHAEFYESDSFRTNLRRKLIEGKSFPRARHEALLEAGISPEDSDVAAFPNNILALEYLRALSTYDKEIHPLPILRSGARHDAPGIGGKYASANAIRKAMLSGKREEAFAALPEAAVEVFREISPVSSNKLSSLILYAFRRMEVTELAQLPDVSEGLENLIYRQCRTARSYEELLMLLKSKRYTLARLRRISMSALLGLKADTAKEGLERAYIRVLGVRKDALPLLSDLAKKAELPIIIRGEDIKDLPTGVQNLLKYDRLSGEIYALAKEEAACKNEFSQPLIIV